MTTSNLYFQLRFSYLHPEILSWGGCPSRTDRRKVLTNVFFFSSKLILQRGSNGLFQGKLLFSKVPEGVQLFPGEGVKFLIPMETYRTCDFHLLLSGLAYAC